MTAIILGARTPGHRPSTSRCTNGRLYPLIDGPPRVSTCGAFERPGPSRRQHEGVRDCMRAFRIVVNGQVVVPLVAREPVEQADRDGVFGEEPAPRLEGPDRKS